MPALRSFSCLEAGLSAAAAHVNDPTPARSAGSGRLALLLAAALMAGIAAAPGPAVVAAAATAAPAVPSGGLPAGPNGPIAPPALQTFVPEGDATAASGTATPHATAPANGANVEPFSGATGGAPTPPPLTATATPKPSGQLVKYAGQILDYRGGFVFFTTGDGFRMARGAKIDDAAGTKATTLVPRTRTYARASFDTGDGSVVQLDLSAQKLPNEAAYDAIKKFAVALSTPKPNPDLGSRPGFDGKPVLVTFKVRVPTRTPFADDVYLATSASNWSATEIKMSRLDALNYGVSREFPSGTVFEYRYTRGSWNAAERGQDGLEDTHKLTVGNGDTQNRSDVVYNWGDEINNAPDLGGGVPTPFQAIPFVLPPHR